jgi:hypothetical protein
MSRLTGKQRRQVQRAIDALDRALRYIRSPRMAVAIRGTPATTTLHYIRPSDGATLYEIEKEIGSDLCGAQSCRDELAQMLNLVTEDQDAA